MHDQSTMYPTTESLSPIMVGRAPVASAPRLKSNQISAAASIELLTSITSAAIRSATSVRSNVGSSWCFFHFILEFRRLNSREFPGSETLEAPCRLLLSGDISPPTKQ